MTENFKLLHLRLGVTLKNLNRKQPFCGEAIYLSGPSGMARNRIPNDRSDYAPRLGPVKTTLTDSNPGIYSGLKDVFYFCRSILFTSVYIHTYLVSIVV